MIALISMAGRGSRMSGHASGQPKPLIPVHGRPMVAWACDSLRSLRPRRWVFVALEEHNHDGAVQRAVESIAPDGTLILLEAVTEGQLCSVLAARGHLEPDESVLIAPSDSVVQHRLEEAIAGAPSSCRGLISVANMPGDRWSFARTSGRDSEVTAVAEKERISDHASTGLYFFGKAGEFLDAADTVIAENRRVRGEFYVMPVYDEYLRRGWRVDIAPADGMLDMGTPDALASAIRQIPSDASHQAS